MTYLRFVLPLILVAFSVISHAQTSEPLFFPADKNNLEVAPQGFSFNLLDDNRIQVGNLIVDTSQMGLQVFPSKNFKDQYQILFTWPAALFKDGLLTIRSADNKVLYPLSIQRKEIKSAPVFRGEKENLHSEKAELLTDNMEPAVIEALKESQYIHLCLSRQDLSSLVELCSREYQVTETKAGGLAFTLRPLGKKTGQVKINDKVVSLSGELPLRKETDDLYFVAVTAYDAYLRLLTHRREVVFQDVISTLDGKNMMLIFTGAEPTDEMNAKRLSASQWEIILPTAHPSMYLKADGEVPMHQTFTVKGPLPKINDRPYLDKSTSFKTYSAGLMVEGDTRDKWVAKPYDNTTTIENDGSHFYWHINDLPEDQISRHYLLITQNDRKYVVEHSIMRGRPFEIALQSSYLLQNHAVTLSGHFQAWLSLHWGAMIDQDQHLTEKLGATPLNLTTFKVFWRVHPGLYKVDPDWGLALLDQNLQSNNGTSSQSLGAGLFWFGAANSKWWRFMDGYHVNLDMYLPAYAGTNKVSFAYDFKALLDSGINDNLDFQYGVESRSYQFTRTSANANDPIGIVGGFAWRF